MELLQVGREELIQEWSASWTWNRKVDAHDMFFSPPGQMEKHPRHEGLHLILRTRRSQEGGEKMSWMIPKRAEPDPHVVRVPFVMEETRSQQGSCQWKIHRESRTMI